MQNNTAHGRYKVGEWRNDTIKSWPLVLYVGGDLGIAERECRHAVFPQGMCVSISPVQSVFAGGTEPTVRIEMFQYPPFPEAEESLIAKLVALGQRIAEANAQWSFSLVTPDLTYFCSRRRA